MESRNPNSLDVVTERHTQQLPYLINTAELFKASGFHGTMPMSILINIFLWHPTVANVFLQVTWIFTLLSTMCPL